MAILTTDSKHYTDIAAAIRGKNGETTTYKPSEMAAAIEAITGGGGKKVASLNILENIGAFVITYEDGTSVTGTATFDENGLPTGMTDDNGNTVTFASGYPISAKDSSGNGVAVLWG